MHIFDMTLWFEVCNALSIYYYYTHHIMRGHIIMIITKYPPTSGYTLDNFSVQCIDPGYILAITTKRSHTGIYEGT